MILLFQRHFLHCRNVRGFTFDQQAAVPSLILGEHSWYLLLAQAKGSWEFSLLSVFLKPCIFHVSF